MVKKAIKTVSAQTAPAHHPIVQPHVPTPTAPLTEAQKIWNEIKTLPIQMFGLPNQLVEQHVQPVSIEPTKLYLAIKASSTLPALETALQGKFNVELADRFLIVSRVVPPLTPKR